MCIPHTGYGILQAAYSLIPMVCKARAQGITVDMLPIGLSLVYTAREEAACAMLSEEYDALLFIDSDMITPENLLTKLVEADKDIVSALAFRRTKPYEPCIFEKCDREDARFWYDYPKGLIEIQGVGMACTLIKRKVFEIVPQPWFFPEPKIGEDLAFCIRAKENGFKIFCNTELICGHCTAETITDSHYFVWKECHK
jgi:GT2 family glycosyltransferase